MEAILSGVQIILAVSLIVLVLLHSGKDTGLSGAFGVGGGAGPLGGGSLVERNLTRWTIFFSILFVANTIVLRPVFAGAGDEQVEDERRASLEAAKEAKYREIRDAELDYRTGKLSEADWRGLDRSLRAEAIELLDALERLE